MNKLINKTNINLRFALFPILARLAIAEENL